ncbi:reverse transcriptase domain-containing protein [Tanacetum coccineum]
MRGRGGKIQKQKRNTTKEEGSSSQVNRQNEKNVVESLVGTLLNVSRKTKDGVNARLDQVELGVKLELFAMQEEDKTTLPLVGYTLTNAEKYIFCEMLYNIKNTDELVPYIERNKQVLKTENPGKRIAFLENEHSKSFAKWLRKEVNHRVGGVKHDTTLGYTLVDLNNLGHKVYPFILASQARQVFYVKDPIDKKISIVFKTPPKNYKDKYEEVDEEFSTVIHQHNNNILPHVDRRDLGDESGNDYYQTDCRDLTMILDSLDDSNGPSISRVPIYGPSVQGLLDYYGYDNIEDYLSDFYFPSIDKEDTIVHTGQDPIHEFHSLKSKAKYVPISQKHNPNVKSPIAITGCVLGLPNVDTWDDILKKLRMRTPGSCADKWMNGKDYGKDNHHVFCIYSSDDTKGVSSKGPSITSIPKEGSSIARLSKALIPKELLAWYGYDIIKDYLPVTKKLISKFIFKRPISIKGCMLGLANVETYDNTVKKFGMRTPGRYADKSKRKRKVNMYQFARNTNQICIAMYQSQDLCWDYQMLLHGMKLKRKWEPGNQKLVQIRQRGNKKVSVEAAPALALIKFFGSHYW